MMSATGRSTASDEAGIFGLLAFLTDPEKAAARLVELRAAADAAEAAQSAAVTAQKDALAAQEAAFAAHAKADDAVEVTVARMKASQDEQARLKSVEAALDVKAKALALQQEASVRYSEKLDEFQLALDARDTALAEQEKTVAALRVEYEEKIKTLRAIAGA